MFTKMVVTLDGSKTAECVLPYARMFVRNSNVPVDLVSIIDFLEMARGFPAAEGLFFDTLADDEARSRHEYLTEVAKTFTDRVVKCYTLKAKPEDAIIEHVAGDKDTLLAMATHGRSGLNRWLLGSVAEKVLRGTNTPLLLVRASDMAAAEASAELNTIMVPLDGSELAETVLPPVIEMAKRLRLGVILFRAYNIPYGFYDVGGGFAIDLNRLLAQTEAEVQHYLEEKSSILRNAGVDVIIASKEGFGADEIIKYIRGMPDCLIALCSHGRSGINRWALGSVAETVVRHCSSPVLVFRGVETEGAKTKR